MKSGCFYTDNSYIILEEAAVTKCNFPIWGRLSASSLQSTAKKGKVKNIDSCTESRASSDLQSNVKVILSKNQ